VWSKQNTLADYTKMEITALRRFMEFVPDRHKCPGIDVIKLFFFVAYALEDITTILIYSLLTMTLLIITLLIKTLLIMTLLIITLLILAYLY
jgi:hypothetical protein